MTDTKSVKEVTEAEVEKAEVEEAVSKKAVEEAVSKNTQIRLLAIKSKASDFKEALEVTRTLHKNKIAITSMSELASAVYASNNRDSATMTQLAELIVNKLKVTDCYHKCDRSAKSDTSMTATIKRHRRHFKHTIKTHHKASQLYSFNDATDSLVFTDKFKTICLNDKIYRAALNELIKKIKVQYKVVKKADKKKDKVVKKADKKKDKVVKKADKKKDKVVKKADKKKVA